MVVMGGSCDKCQLYIPLQECDLGTWGSVSALGRMLHTTRSMVSNPYDITWQQCVRESVRKRHLAKAAIQG